MPWTTPITNWTKNDYYNAFDMNRVESNTEYLRTFIISLGYSIPTLNFNLSRIGTSWDNLNSINRIESNLETIKTNFVTPSGWEPTITWTADTKFNATEANRWENSTLLLYNAAINTQQAFRYAGTFNLAQEVLPQI